MATDIDGKPVPNKKYRKVHEENKSKIKNSKRSGKKKNQAMKIEKRNHRVILDKPRKKK